MECKYLLKRRRGQRILVGWNQGVVGAMTGEDGVDSRCNRAASDVAALHM